MKSFIGTNHYENYSTNKDNDLTDRLLECDPPIGADGSSISSNYDQTDNQQQQEKGGNLYKNQVVVHGEKQPPLFRDWPFAVLFYIQFFAILVLGGYYGSSVLVTQGSSSSSSSNETQYDYSNFIFLSLLAGVSAIVISSLSVIVLSRSDNAMLVISFSLALSVVLSFILALLAIVLFGNILGGIIGLVFTLLSLWYAMSVRGRIPFAAANLSTALCAIRSSSDSISTSGAGLLSVAYGLTFIMFGWFLVWTVGCVGMNAIKASYESETLKDMDQHNGLNMLMLLSLYWTQQVVRNIITVTVAGVVGSWWFHSSTSTTSAPLSAFDRKRSCACCCSESVQDSLVRAVTYSFGSICFGSLLVALIQVLKAIVESARRNNDSEGRTRRNDYSNSLLLCVLDCILSFLEDIATYFHRWAYIYVGLYGYNYITAGKKVLSLFEARGWTLIINDNLIGNTLSLVGLVIALLTGVLGALADSLVTGGWFPEFGDGSTYVSFLLSFIVAFVLAMITMGAVDSAVNTVIVCFAEAPEELEMNHPSHSSTLRSAWRQGYGVVF